jgi:hypothetical protein
MDLFGPRAEDFEPLKRRFFETTDADERIELLRQMCELVQMAHLVLKCELSEFWH